MMKETPSKRFLRDYYEGKAAKVDEMALTYIHPNWYKRWFYQTRSTAVLRALAPVPGDQILDVGSGPGYYGNIMAGRGATVLSMDIARGFLRQALSTRLLGRKICADAGALPFKDGTFAKVLATEVVEHTIDPDRVVAEIARVLKPHGNAVITAPSADSYMDWMYAVKRKVCRFPFDEHLQELAPETFRRLLGRHLVVQRMSFANFVMPFPLDLLTMRIPESMRPGLDKVERRLESSVNLSPQGWTMIARCEKA